MAGLAATTIYFFHHSVSIGEIFVAFDDFVLFDDDFLPLGLASDWEMVWDAMN